MPSVDDLTDLATLKSYISPAVGSSSVSDVILGNIITGVSQALDRAAVGDFSVRAPEVGVAPELTELTVQANRTLDRLEELLSWLRDSADQLAHDFRTPLARATARMERLAETGILTSAAVWGWRRPMISRP